MVNLKAIGAEEDLTIIEVEEEVDPIEVDIRIRILSRWFSRQFT